MQYSVVKSTEKEARTNPQMMVSRYFFVVNQESGLVLNVSTGKKGGKLVLSEAHQGSSQLWRWDEDCRLVSKLGLVADIKGKKKKTGAVCHGWNAHDGLNQKWRVEEGAIKSNLSNLVIHGVNQMISMQKVIGSSSQKWYFIPEDAWNDFLLVQADPNPLNKAQFWKNLADNNLDVIIGYNIEDYEGKLRKAFEIMDECAGQLDKVAKDTGIAGTVGGSASIVAGGMIVAGILLSPVTGGVSLGLSVAGAATGVAAGVTSVASSLVNQHWDKRKAKEINKATAPLFRATFSLQGFLNEYIKNLKEAAEYLKTPEGEAEAKYAYTFAEVTRGVGSVAWRAYKIGDTVYTGVKHVKEAKRIKALVNFIQADYYVVKEARIGLATQAAAPGVKIPILGKTIVAAGTTSAKVLSGSLAVFGIAFGIWDVIGGAKKIANGSQLAEEFRKSSENLKAESNKLIKLYKELQ